MMIPLQISSSNTKNLYKLQKEYNSFNNLYGDSYNHNTLLNTNSIITNNYSNGTLITNNDGSYTIANNNYNQIIQPLFTIINNQTNNLLLLLL